MVAPYQKSIISAIAEFINNNPQGEPEDSQDILATLTETLRSAIGLNHRIIVEPESRVVDLLFTIANLGEGNLYLCGLISDGFEEFCEELYNDFIPLCEKVLPQILAALDRGVHDKDSPITCVWTPSCQLMTIKLMRVKIVCCKFAVFACSERCRTSPQWIRRSGGSSGGKVAVDLNGK